MKPDTQSRSFLQTAVVNLHTTNGTIQHVRTLIDPGAQVSLISENLVKVLNLKPNYSNYPVRATGLNSEVDYVSNEMVDLTLANTKIANKCISVNFHVIPDCVWKYIPPDSVCDWIKKLTSFLADPEVLQPVRFPLIFQVILSVGYSIQVLHPTPLY